MPVPISEILAVINGGRELASALSREARSTNSRRQIHDLGEMLRVLRTIYFEPGGTRAILEVLAEGRRPDEEMVREILPRFNDYEYRMARDLHHLTFRTTSDVGLDVRAREVLHRINSGKGGVRAKVQEILNESLTYDLTVPAQEASDLLAEIDGLNSEIAEAERTIMNLLKELM